MKFELSKERYYFTVQSDPKVLVSIECLLREILWVLSTLFLFKYIQLECRLLRIQVYGHALQSCAFVDFYFIE